MLALSTYMGHVKISNTYWYLTAVPELMTVAAGQFEQFALGREVQNDNTARALPSAPSFCALVQAFSPSISLRSVRSARGRWRPTETHSCCSWPLPRRTWPKRRPKMAMADFTEELVLAFLDHLELERHNTVRSRNARLAALRAFLKFASHRDLSSLHSIEQALGIPMKRFEPPMLGFLSREEMLAVIGAPGHTWVSQRDHLLWVLLYNTGARVSEITAVTVADVVLDDARLSSPTRQGTQAACGAAVAINGAGNPWLAADKSPAGRQLRIAAEPRWSRDDPIQCDQATDPGRTDGRDAACWSSQTPDLSPLHQAYDRDAPAAGGSGH